MSKDQALLTRAYQHHIIKYGTNPCCRLCDKSQETIDHIISGCPELAKTEYIHRHNKVETRLHWNICKEYKVDTVDTWYKHNPKTVVEKVDITMMHDMPIQTDRTITTKCPDIVIKNRWENKCTLVDMPYRLTKTLPLKYQRNCPNTRIWRKRPHVAEENSGNSCCCRCPWSY